MSKRKQFRKHLFKNKFHFLLTANNLENEIQKQLNAELQHSTKDKELTIMKMDHNEFDCIKDNSSSLAPGSPHPERLSELQA